MQKKIKILEMFAGTRSMGKASEILGGFECFSTDLISYDGKTSLLKDVLDLYIDDLPWIPDVVWASVPCTSYSIASGGYHRGRDLLPKTQTAILGDKIVLKTLSIIDEIQKINPHLVWYVENPRGLLRKMPFMQDVGFVRTVTYCQYGSKYMKPTDIWTNNFFWIPRKMCSPGDSCHQAATRNTYGGLRSVPKGKNRSIIPELLCKEILLVSQEYLNHIK